MCIAIVKPAVRRVTKERLEICHHNNPDGAGFAYINDKNKLVIRKGFFKFSKFWKAYEREAADKKALIHFRITTVGKTCQKNCHPWHVGNNTAMVHNGTIGNISPEEGLSDSGTLAKWLRSMNGEKGTGFMSKSGQKVLESLVKPSRVAFMNHRGFALLHQDSWKHEDGVWYSNESYKVRKQKRTYSGQSYNNSRSHASWWEQNRQAKESNGSSKGTAKPPEARGGNEVLGYSNSSLHSRMDRIRKFLPANTEYNTTLMKALEAARYAYSAQSEPYTAMRAMLGELLDPGKGISRSVHEMNESEVRYVKRKACTNLIYTLGERLMNTESRALTVGERRILDELFTVDLVWALKAQGEFDDLSYFKNREEKSNPSPVTKTPQGGKPRKDRMTLARAKELLQIQEIHQDA